MTVEGVAGTDVTMVQATDYPWSGKVSITVSLAAEREFSVKVRVPNRRVSELYTATPPSDGITSFALNGSAIEPQVENGYAVITRTWRAGDKIDLVLPMKIQRITGSDKIEATRGRVALQYGPLVYCAEAVEQELDKALDPASPLTTKWKPDLLGGVKVIQGIWADGSPLTAIPYYARANRAEGAADPKAAAHSTVWLKEQ